MTLGELLAMQADLNRYCDRSPTKTEIHWAIAAELGELANATKANWCWWKRNDKAFHNESRQAVATEIADILCFLLTGILMPNYGYEIAANREWGCFDFSLDSPSHIERALGFGNYGLAIAHLGALAAHLGYDRDEIEAAYIKKVQVNRQRWEGAA